MSAPSEATLASAMSAGQCRLRIRLAHLRASSGAGGSEAKELAPIHHSNRAVKGNSDVQGLPAHVAGLYLAFMRTIAASFEMRWLGVA